MATLVLAVFGFICLAAVFRSAKPQGVSDDTLNIIELNRQMQQNQFFQDRRQRDGWWVLYPFGELYNDIELLNQPNLDRQIDLDFYYPFYGFRYNYTYIIPNGILAFSRPEYIQPPYTFPNPKWPEMRDPSFIAPFFAEATYQYVGETGISHVWYRTVHRPRLMDWENQWYQNQPRTGVPPGQQLNQFQGVFNPLEPGFQRQAGLKVQPGFVEDQYFLDNITRDIQENIIGAHGWQANHALVVTWERLAYGGSPKYLEVNMFEQVKQWQNTYQVVLASDEIRSYAIFNYATINWTSSNEAGALFGRGGKQSAIAGFNGGNGTGFTPMHYNGEGEIYKLAWYSPGVLPGRWVYRVDEEIIQGGCSNKSLGPMYTAPTQASMLGGMLVNVSGPCIRPGDNVVILFDEYVVNCQRFHSGRARCIMPKFHKIGLINTKFSVDGGMTFPFVGTFYVVHPERALHDVVLWNDVVNTQNNWDNPHADTLTIKWAPYNLTNTMNARVRIDLMGYWEDTMRSSFEMAGIVSETTTNNGLFTFQPRNLARAFTRDQNLYNKWKLYNFGVVRISVPDDPSVGVLYSHPVSFAWYFLDDWTREYGKNWALDRCIEWFEYDGNRRNFWMDLDGCPCVLDQALLDQGRFMPVFSCDMLGDSGCPYHRGAQHCVMSVQASWTGAQQVCCYDFQGWLMFSDDYEYNTDYLFYYTAGTPYRAHTFGSYPYKIPPWIPTFSNYYNDIMSYSMCCKYAGHCELYYWRRQSHGCQGYKPPVAGFAYGDAHFVTFDGVQYTFNGKGYYVLAMSDHPHNKLMVQARMEQPPKTTWGTYPNATVITGVAVRENESDVVQLLARTEFRRWRYSMDILVNGIPCFFDTPDKKWLKFKGLSLFNPSRNLNQSEIIVQLDSGAGVRVSEAYGILDVTVFLPPSYNETYKFFGQFGQTDFGLSRTGNPNSYYRTYGLLGTYNGEYADDLMTPQGARVGVTRKNMQNDADSRMLYDNFGRLWRVDGTDDFIGPVLFQMDRVRPIYNPLLFSSLNYVPSFDVTRVAPNATYIFSLNEVRDACQDNYACKYDYIHTGVREIAMNTLSVEQKFLGLKAKGQKYLISCGALAKAEGAIKTPLGNNYLDGVTVTFTCRPEYFLHGSQQRTCVNGTWSPGWWVWCRERTEEYALKYLTGILVSLAFIAIVTVIFCCCYCAFVRPLRRRDARVGGRYAMQHPSAVSAPFPPHSGDKTLELPAKELPPPPPVAFGSTKNVMQLEREPRSANGNSNHYAEGGVRVFQQTST